MTLQPKASHYIDGTFVEDTSGTLIPVLFPGTGEVIATVHEATPAVIDQAISAAVRAQRDWAKMRPLERGRILTRAAQLIQERAEELARLETWDTGKPLMETRVADWPSVAESLEWFAGLAPSVGGETVSLGRDFGYTVREPVGICVGIGAWNYPTQSAGWKSAPALAFGNAMIFKPSELTPLGALKLAEIYTEAGLPPGLFNVVQGTGRVGQALMSDPRVNKVSLTGSVPTGQKVYAAAAPDLKLVTLELGGKSPLIIFDDADLELAVGAALLGNFYSTGQVCSNGTRVFVARTIHDAFLERAVARTRAIRIGDPFDETTQMGPLISEKHRERVMSYIAKGEAEGAECVTGGRALNRPGFFIEPTIFARVEDTMTIAREEIFGPVMCVLPFDDEEEVIARANASEYGLSAGVITQDLTRAHRVVAQLEAGTCWINTYNFAPAELPFGGVKRSGFGRENGHAAVAYYTRIKSVYVGMGPLDAPY